MTSNKTICGVLLHNEAYEILGEAINSYIQEGRIGKFMYCVSATQNGSFVDLVFDPSQCNGDVACPMQISIPIHYVKFMVIGITESQIGFLSRI